MQKQKMQRDIEKDETQTFR